MPETIDEIRTRAAERARCAALEEGAWYSLAQTAGMLGLFRQVLYKHLEELTTRRGKAHATIRIRADEKLEALCRRLYVNVKIGDRPATLAKWYGDRC
jgi:hypothetical protein